MEVLVVRVSQQIIHSMTIEQAPPLCWFMQAALVVVWDPFSARKSEKHNTNSRNVRRCVLYATQGIDPLSAKSESHNARSVPPMPAQLHVCQLLRVSSVMLTEF